MFVRVKGPVKQHPDCCFQCHRVLHEDGENTQVCKCTGPCSILVSLIFHHVGVADNLEVPRDDPGEGGGEGVKIPHIAYVVPPISCRHCDTVVGFDTDCGMFHRMLGIPVELL